MEEEIEDAWARREAYQLSFRRSSS